MNAAQARPTMRPSLARVGRLSLRALRAPPAAAGAGGAAAPAAAAPLAPAAAACGQLRGAGALRGALAARPQTLPAAARRSLAAAPRASAAAAAPSAPAPSAPAPAGAQANGAAAGPGASGAAPTFQEAIKRLQDFWAAAGCVVWLPHNTEVGAGTMNPATFLRVLGPEPWNVCYPEPSIRPDDSRYGDNPNRVQRHTQFQVILKPDPGNAQELYLGSLEALGIDTRAHDVRFVEDNWESPVLGAWGLGWEVWLDGMEVTQFTYFQQAGGKALDAPAVEITYGLERILMSLQGVKHFKDIRYAEGVTYGELFLQNEYEMSVFNLDEADVAEQRSRFALCEAEARRLLAKRLPVPAYDMLLKCSHAFNIMDARGAVGVTERADCFATMRALAREVTALWMARREELGHPLGVVPGPAPAGKAPAGGAVAGPPGAAPFVLEIGSEELPPDDVQAGMAQLRERVPALLSKLRLPHGGVEVHGTPRRLAVLVHDLAAAQTPQESKVRGPPAKAAYDATGAPSKALEGFCRKAGVPVDAVTVEADAKGVEYCWVQQADAGKPAVEVLAAELPGLVGGLGFRKSMRWNAAGAAYSRPLRWLLALHGDAAVRCDYAGLSSAPATRVLRNADTPELPVPSAAAYGDVLRGAGIALDFAARRAAIWDGATAAAAEVGGVIPESASGELLDEVANLVESPTLVRGAFDPAFLSLPQEVLVMVMRKHQRYFPVFAPAADGGGLLPAFVTVANGPVDVPAVAAGNEAVLRARFEDAAFFYREDLSTTLADLRPKLKGTMFQKDLGSLFDKTLRIEALAPRLAAAMGLGAATDAAAAAAALCKADLASATVTEMTALAGTMGRHYAQAQGLPEDVATAIFESVLPRQAGDALPASPAGVVVAVADRLDSLVGLVAAVGAPSATADPYGLRRAAYGMLQALVSNGVPLSLRAAVALAAGEQPIPVSAEQQAAVLEFVGRRLEQLLVDSGVPPEAVRAVLAERGDDPALAAATAAQLQAALSAGEAGALRGVMTALSRPTRIVRGKAVPDASIAVDPALFEADEERGLHAALLATRAALDAASAAAGGAPPSVDAWLAAAGGLVAPIDAFFDKVFVMCEDEGVRANRLALLRDVAGVTAGFVDLSQLPGF
ncbi:EDD1 [Scenedesmus sp. PABB004]|nr:EDD1 [Scenedesmus sp. PABB004]